MGVRLPGNPLVFPGGNAVFNPAHPAAGNNVRYSGVARAGSMINLITGKGATVNGAITAGVHGKIGATVVNTTSTAYLSAPGLILASTALTFGAIFAPTAALANSVLFSTAGGSGSAADTWFQNASGLGPGLFVGNSFQNSGLILTNGVPYFIAVSFNGATMNSIATNLNTGVSATASAPVAKAIATPNVATYILGGIPSAGFQMDGALAAIMYSANNFLSLPQLLNWAQSPWDFWYPPTLRNLISQSLKGGPSGAVLSLAAAQGSYALAGKPQAFAAGLSMAAAKGTYNVAGQAVAFLKAHGFVGASGVYALTGNPQVLRQAGFGAVRGSYALAGQAATLAVGAPASQGSYTLSGKTVAFPVHLSLLAASGQYTLSGFSPSGGGGSGPPFSGRHSLEFIADVAPGMTR